MSMFANSSKLVNYFQQFDEDGNGTISRDELGRLLTRLNPAVFNDFSVGLVMREIDVNGDGIIDYFEFANWLMRGGSSAKIFSDQDASQEEPAHCEFWLKGSCKYSGTCQYKHDNALKGSAQPREASPWEAREGERDEVVNVADIEVPEKALQPPNYWTNQSLDNDFEDWEPPHAAPKDVIKRLAMTTFKRITTSDRCGVAPAGLKVVDIHRVENNRLWQKYAAHRYKIRAKRSRPCTPISRLAGSTLATDVEGTAMDGRLQSRVNEVYLWHGTSPAGATGIASNGFDRSRCGSGAGSMYGPGFYLAEASSKSDEYASDDKKGPYKGIYCLILVRVVLGEVLHMTTGGDSVHPAIKAAMQCGSYDSVLGDRAASVGTYREFVVYDEAQVYPEYVISYKRRTESEAAAVPAAPAPPAPAREASVVSRLVFIREPLFELDGAACLDEERGASADLPMGNSPYTIETYVKISAMNMRSNQCLVSWGRGRSSAVSFYITGWSSWLGVAWDGNDLNVNVPSLRDEAWHHVATTYDGTTRRLFLDFQEVGQDSPGALSVARKDNFSIGSLDRSYDYFQGAMMHFRIWSVVRTAEEMRTM